ncbi:hypothetical protein HW115_06115 [Verrucomicrobiaceae bacterium N1E253]|uniref:Uncharacterized protein n=1 Tax=Oceaniferula marina TaxID=2748318 RepID=A0A851GJ90_9BACT|nr:hypothetical protein [Oceaniferula marina]NWK55177.1 hypothetical protein [Oceaniferula marina]
MKKVLILAAVAVVSLLIANFLMVWGNPEVVFWKEYMDRNSARLEQMRSNNPDVPVILVTGGSSCSFSLDPIVIEQKTGIPTCNMGGSASMGASYLVANTLAHARRGDVVILAIEPALLSKFTEPEEIPLALEMAIIQGHPLRAVGRPVTNRDMQLKDIIATLRPGSRYFSTMISKLATGRPLYRYTMDDWQDGGRLSTDYKDSLLKPNELMTRPFPINGMGNDLLQQAVLYCEQKGIKLCYSMPWIFTQKEVVDANRGYNLDFLDEVSRIMPVLRGGHLGVCAERKLYADTSYHLSEEGAYLRSVELAEELNKWLIKELNQ